jgi:hypothetical protein
VTFNALNPEPGDDGTLNFQIRKHGTGESFVAAKMASVPSFSNGGTWIIDDLEEGVTYDIQTKLVINGADIVSSQIVTATAPATDIKIVLTVTWKELPQQSITSSQNKTISGTLQVAGYIPKDAFYAIFTAPARDNSDLGAEEVDDPQFTRVINGVVAHTDNDWKWDGALAQVDYRVRAELYTATGEYIGTSNIENAVVPQNDVALVLQSKAVTEPITTPISGKVKLNGGYKSDSEIVVQARANGSGGFADVDRFPAESNRDWVFKDAKSGVQYDVRAVLRRQGEDQAQSSQQSTTAPAKDILLTINSSLDLDDPTQKPEIIECDEDDGEYDATIRFPGVDSARAYWIRIGKENNSGDRFNESEEPDEYGEDVDVKVRIDEDTYYYADYAYTYCSDCETLDSYSDFSSSLKFYCGDEPDDD